MVSDDRRIEKRIERIDPARGPDGSTDEEIDDCDRDVLLDFYDRITSINKTESRFSEHRILALLDTMILASKHVDIPLDETQLNNETGEDAVDAVVDWMDNVYDENSLDLRFACFKVWGEVMTPEDGQPDRFDTITLNNSPDDPTPQASNILHYEKQIIPIIQHQYNARDKAIVATQWSAGGRPRSEMHKLTIRDVEIKDGYVLISIPEDTKTGSREIKMHTGAPYLIQWYENHPGHDTEEGLQPDMPLWTHVRDGYGDPYDRICYNSYVRPFENASEALDISKTITAQHCRRSRASDLAAKTYISQLDLEMRFGWQRNSEAPRHYIVAFDESSEDRIAAADGADVDPEADTPNIAPVRCEGCGRWTERYVDECIWCRTVVPADVTDIQETPAILDDANLLDMIVDGEIVARDLRALQRLEPVIKQRSDLFARLESYIRLAERHEDSGDDDSSIGDGVA